MANSNAKRVREIFEEAIELSEAERQAFLESACAEDSQLRSTVDRLIKVYIEDGCDNSHTDLESHERAHSSIKGKIGRFRILQKIGEGGFGEVWMAEQVEPVKRRVAIKIIKPGMDSKQVIARFEAERQALAIMEHPNIARVYDGGETEEGRPYFVMELVSGETISAYCASNHLNVSQRIELFRSVCAAVQHAHQKGIIHRDLKPSNVLVCEINGNPVVKVIDFGIAKALERPLTDKTLFTEFQQMVGTPAYMSPEQASLSMIDVDTRSDVYSLGVLLYELLAGGPPFDPKSLRSAGFDEMRRIIREVEPPSPSLRLSSGQSASDTDDLTSEAERDQRKRKVRGELDWIVQRAMAKERDRRYASASEFDDDLERYLNGDAVRAGPAGKWYRARRFMARNRVPLAVAGSIAVALIAGIIATTVFAVKAERQRQQTLQEFARAEAVKSFLTDMLSSVNPRTSGSMDKELMALVLKNAAAKIDQELQDQPLISVELSTVIGMTYQSLGMYDAAEPHIIRALEFSREHLGDEHPDTLLSINTMGVLLVNQGKYAEAKEYYAEALKANRRLLGDAHPDTLRSIANMGSLLTQQGKYEEAMPYHIESMEGFRQVLGDEHPQTLHSISYMGLLFVNQGKYNEAMPYYHEALEGRRHVLGDEHPLTLNSIHNMGTLLSNQGKLDDAMECYVEVLEIRRRILGNQHPHTLLAINAMGFLLQQQGKYEDALEYYTEAIEGRRRVLGDEHPDTLISIADMGTLLSRQGKYEEALPYVVETLKAQRRVMGEKHPSTLRSIKQLGNLLAKQGKYDEAMPYLTEAIESRRRVLGDEHQDTLSAIYSMGTLLCRQGKYDEAMPYLTEALETSRSVLGDEHQGTLVSINTMGLLLLQQGKYDEAMSYLTEALEGRRRVLGDEHPETYVSISGMGKLYTRMHEKEPEKGYDAKAAEYRTLYSTLSGTPRAKEAVEGQGTSVTTAQADTPKDE